MESKWISVEERLPDKAGWYIVTSKWEDKAEYSVEFLEYGTPVSEEWKGSDRVFANGYAFGTNWGYNGETEMDNLEKVIAWMPIPEPYKEGTK